MKKLTIIILILFFITGCKSYTELNDLSIVSIMGIDYKNDNFKLVVNVIEGKKDDDEIEKKITTLESKANSLDECFNTIYKTSSKRLYLSHIDLVILTSDAINNNLKDIINHFLNNNEYRNNFKIILLKDIDLSDFLNNKIDSKEIISLIKTNSLESGITTLKDYETVLNELLIDKNTYLPTITYQDNTINMRGYTFIKNYKIYEELSDKESILLNLLSNKINKTYINNTNILDNEMVITSNKNKITFNFITTISKNNNFEKDIKKDLSDFLTKYQKQDIDILKLKEIIRKNNYKYYKNNNNLLKKLEFNFKFEIKVQENDLIGDDIFE